MEEKIYLREYPYVGITGHIYHPYFYKNNWYIIYDRPVSFYHMVCLCHIPEDEALILKLKYGTGISLQPVETTIK